MPVEEPTTSSPPSPVTAVPPAGITATPAEPLVASSSEAIVEQPKISLAPLPAASQPPAPWQEERHASNVDRLLASMVLVAAFFLGAFAVRNTDVWMQLASGRDLFSGKYDPFSGVDPYSHTTSSTTWVNHSWLFGAGLYLLHEAVGMEGLVLFKALVAVGIALIMMLVGRAGRNLWGNTLATALAILAASTLFNLQPVILSFLFLALTLYFLQRGGGWLFSVKERPIPDPVTWKAYWPILVLFVLWVNLDEWFVLGPLTVALYLAGQALQQSFPTLPAPRRGEVRALGITLLAGLAVCLVNPFHIQAFRLPTLLGWSSTAALMREDPDMQALVLAPLDGVNFEAEKLQAAHLAYFVLAAGLMASFAVNTGGFRWWRALLAGVLLVLSLFAQRMVPFFAVVAGPILALNAQEAAVRMRRSNMRHDPGAVLGRAFGLLLLLALLATAWPGLLHGKSFERRRFSLQDDLDPALRHVALRLQELHNDGVLGNDARVYNYAATVGDAMAWYAPDVKSYIDNRPALFATTIPPFIELRKALTNVDNAQPWTEQLRTQKIDYVVLYNINPGRLIEPTRQLLLQPIGQKNKDWALAHVRGGAMLFLRRDKAPEAQQLELKFDQLAFHPEPALVASAQGMSRLPSSPPLWAMYTDPPPSRSTEAAEAAVHLNIFEVKSQELAIHHQRVWENVLAVVAVTNGIGIGPGSWNGLGALVPAQMSQGFNALVQHVAAGKTTPPGLWERMMMHEIQQFRQVFDSGPPEHLYLAIRACRRALSKHANDVPALATMGRAYYLLQTRTLERLLLPPLMRETRHVQAVSALQGALLYRQDDPVIHAILAELYGSIGQSERGDLRDGYKDLELKHRRLALKYYRAAGPRSREQRERFLADIEEMERNLEALEKQVEIWSNRYETRTRGRSQSPFLRAKQALELNLAGKALEILLDSNFASFGYEGVNLQLELAFRTGKAHQVKTWLDDLSQQEEQLRAGLDQISPGNYARLRLFLALSSGDYESTDARLIEMAKTSTGGRQRLAALLRSGVDLGRRNETDFDDLQSTDAFAAVVTKALFDALRPSHELWIGLLHPVSVSWINLTRDERDSLMQLGVRNLFGPVVGREADIHLMRGVFALEQGDRKRAESAFAEVDRLCDLTRGVDKVKVLPRYPVQLIAQMYLDKGKTPKPAPTTKP